MAAKIWTPNQLEISNEAAWIESQIKHLGQEQIETLTKEASKALKLSYSPYSNYKVGVAIQTMSGKIYQGSNLERVSYSETVHGEETAIINAMLDGAVEREGRRFLHVVAVSHASDSAPCGHCRQIMTEHCDNCLIITADPEGKVRRITSLGIILPYAFSPSDLGIK